MNNFFNNMIRIGTVSSVNETERTARVRFEEMDDIVSGELYILQHYQAGVTVENGEQTYTGALGYWLPAVGQTVVCLYVPVRNGDGYILGGL